ncbi:hypothetical protein BJV78DRAFT_175190 [Lactifluus subvellereus]|nr:hypothetical protein BJV78DRAFT_175190 [Lactifluus subvellereus]
MTLPVDCKEIIIAEKEWTKQVPFGGDHKPRSGQISPDIVPRCFPPFEGLQSVDDGKRGEVVQRVINPRQARLTQVVQQKGSFYYVMKSLAAERERCNILRVQIRSDLFDQLGREREERHVSVNHPTALVASQRSAATSNMTTRDQAWHARRLPRVNCMISNCVQLLNPSLLSWWIEKYL